jgi:hypothetical protein
MKALCIEGPATHDDAEPCVDVREGAGEALARVRTGRPLSPETVSDRGADAIPIWWKATSAAALSQAAAGPRGVKEPEHVRNLHAREPGDPRLARAVDHRVGRSGKAEAARLR